MLIKVTEDCIKNGLPSTSDCCPVALALKDAGLDCRVTSRTIEKAAVVKVLKPNMTSITGNCQLSVDYITFMGYEEWKTLDKQCRDFIYNFDKGLPVEPFEFEI